MALYLVTGGAGFIGSHIVEELVRRGHSVRVLDNLSSGNKQNLADVRDLVDFQLADVRNLESFQPYFAGVDYVLHLAAIVSVVQSMQDPAETTMVNLNGTLNVLLAARQAGVNRVVLASTAAAYGNSPALPHRETQAPQPLSPYAVSKLAGEYYGQIFQRDFGLDVVALRFFNIFGPRQDPHSAYSGVLSKFLAACLNGEAPAIFGDGEQSRDFTYVANVVDAVLRACQAPEAPGKVINVGTGSSLSLNQIIQVLSAILGTPVTPRYSSPQPGDVRHSVADITLARTLLGYEPVVGFDEGLRCTLEWMRTTLTEGSSAAISR